MGLFKGIKWLSEQGAKDPHISKEGFSIGNDKAFDEYFLQSRGAGAREAVPTQFSPVVTNKVTGNQTPNFVDPTKVVPPTPAEIEAKLVSSHLNKPKSGLARSLAELSEGRLTSQSITERWNTYFKKLRKAGEPLPSNEELIKIFRNPKHPLHSQFYGDIKVKPKFSKGANTYLERQGLLKPENNKKGYSKYQLMNDRFSGSDWDANKFSDLVEKNTVDGLGIDLIDSPDPVFLNLGGKKYIQGDNVFFLAMKDLGVDASRVRQHLNRSGLDTKDWVSLSDELQSYITKGQVGRRAPRHLREEVTALRLVKDLGI